MLDLNYPSFAYTRIKMWQKNQPVAEHSKLFCRGCCSLTGLPSFSVFSSTKTHVHTQLEKPFIKIQKNKVAKFFRCTPGNFRALHRGKKMCFPILNYKLWDLQVQKRYLSLLVGSNSGVLCSPVQLASCCGCACCCLSLPTLSIQKPEGNFYLQDEGRKLFQHLE